MISSIKLVNGNDIVLETTGNIIVYNVLLDSPRLEHIIVNGMKAETLCHDVWKNECGGKPYRSLIKFVRR